MLSIDSRDKQMKPSYICRLISMVIATLFIIACSENSDNEANESETAQSDIPSCQTRNLRMPLSTAPDFGDGSDGELYLASGEVFFLEARSYNFSNIYTEADSVLTVLEDTMESGGGIQINAVGNCELYGELAFANSKGPVELNCGGQINLSGDIDISGNSITISTISPESTGSETSNPNTASGTIISSSNIDSGLSSGPSTVDATIIDFTGDALNTDSLSIKLNDSIVIEGGVLDLEDAIINPNIVDNCLIPQK